MAARSGAEARAALEALERAAECPICGATLDTPLLLKSCGHSFCSGCIRQNLDFQERSGPPSCPTCRKPCDARDLQANSALREVLQSYAAARPQLLAVIEQHQQLAEQAQQQAAAGNQQVAGGGRRQRVMPAGNKRRSGSREAGHAADGAVVGGSSARKRCAGSAAVTKSHTGRARGGGTAAAVGNSAGEELVDLAAESSSSGSSSDGGSDWQASGGSAAAGREDSSSECEHGAVSSDWSDGSEGPMPKRQRRPPQRGTRSTSRGPATAEEKQAAEGGKAAAAVTATADLDTPSGFVRCPVCSKLVPAFYINSHVDLCLIGGATGSGSTHHTTTAQHRAEAEAASGSRPGWGQPQLAEAAAASFEPLGVPPKIVGSLATEKALRATLKRYGLPTDGKKAVLLERYGKLRLAVEVANDKQERTSYERLAKRVVQQEKQSAALKMLSAGGKQAVAAAAGGKQAVAAAAAAAGLQAAGPAGPSGAAAAAAAAGVEAGAPGAQEGHPARPGAVPFGCSYKELIQITRQRDAALRAARAAQRQHQQQAQAAAGDVGAGTGEGANSGAKSLEARPKAAEQGQEVQAVGWQEEEIEEDDGSSALWEQLPLSQAHEHAWRERLQRCHSHEPQQGKEQQEQQQPNSQSRGGGHARRVADPC